MTTPQSILHDLHYQLKSLTETLNGKYKCQDENEDQKDIYDICKAIEIETTEFNERMQLLEDKMDLIIKLLGKSNV